ncbi:MAG: DUF1320 domain-containing protein [Phycisphaerales bacterium]|nr:DUF1320 domain-containing protein [Phycisphaerales bacterium]MCB9855937.1 DUF1320 domain-containing protein [Phycisphaerales bacterium]MCB9864082.1 DUF1320 domain-containing protein [Phycisphaerales bacterium]
MAYVSNADIQALLGTAATIELTDDAGSGTINASILTTARIGAEGEANSYFATRYRVPVELSNEAEVAAVIQTFVLDLAVYRLHSRKPPIPDDIVRRRQEAVAWLSRVADGRVRLPSIALLQDNDAAGLIGKATGPTRTMTRESLDDI